MLLEVSLREPIPDVLPDGSPIDTAEAVMEIEGR